MIPVEISSPQFIGFSQLMFQQHASSSTCRSTNYSLLNMLLLVLLLQKEGRRLLHD